jgi:diketogulonate reductase-like aldo/keto reductase
VIPKTSHEQRLSENLDVFDFELPADVVRELDACDTLDGTVRAVEFPWW